MHVEWMRFFRASHHIPKISPKELQPRTFFVVHSAGIFDSEESVCVVVVPPMQQRTNECLSFDFHCGSSCLPSLPPAMLLCCVTHTWAYPSHTLERIFTWKNKTVQDCEEIHGPLTYITKKISAVESHTQCSRAHVHIKTTDERWRTNESQLEKKNQRKR